MAIDSEIFDGELPGLATALAASAPAIGLDDDHNFAAGPEPAIVGPFAAYSADPRAFLEQGEAEHSGWRGLIVQGEASIATVDVLHREEGGPVYGFRGKDSAEALAEALNVARQFEGDERHFAMRWLSLPEIYVTALWLRGPATLFIPTRFGSAERPPIELVDGETFMARLRPLIDRGLSRHADFLGDEAPRSGLR